MNEAIGAAIMRVGKFAAICAGLSAKRSQVQIGGRILEYPQEEGAAWGSLKW